MKAISIKLAILVKRMGLQKNPALRFLVYFLVFSFPFSVFAKIPVSMLGAFVYGRDSTFREGLHRDLGQDLAADTGFLVYDLRRKYSFRIDSAYIKNELKNKSFLSGMSGGLIQWGFVIDCENIKDEMICRMEAINMASAEVTQLDTIHLLAEAGEKRKQFSEALVRPFFQHFLEKKENKKPMGLLRINPPANPAMLVRGLQIIKRGSVSEIPLGSTVVLGDAPILSVFTMENTHYILYPYSSYTYILPKVVQLNRGTLGILKGQDTSSLEGKLRSVTALDNSNLLWKSLAKVAALDSTNVIWKGLGKVTSLDSHNLLFKTLSQVTSLDTTNLLIQTLTQVAALDSNNLVWKGLGQVSALDSNNLIWKKLNQIASLDSNSIWKKLGLLAFQEQSVILTPTSITRGEPQAVLFRHEGNLSTIEVVKGTLSMQPLLSSQLPISVGALRVLRTRGYSLKQERLHAIRGDKILRELETANPARGKRNLAMFLPGKFFAMGSSLRTPNRNIQTFMANEFKELDMELDILSSEKEGWIDFPGTFRTGSQEAGCYLCSPDRLGP